MEDKITWTITRDRIKYSKEREKYFFIVGLAFAVVSIVLANFTFTLLILVVTLLLIRIMRMPAEIYKIEINEEGILAENTIIPFKNISGFNIIDVPGERARLIIETNKELDPTKTITIYDRDMEKIEEALLGENIEKKEELELTLLDTLTRYF